MNNLHRRTPEDIDFEGKEYKFLLEPVKYIEVEIPKKSNTKFGSMAQLSRALRQLKYINRKISFEDFLVFAKNWNEVFEENKYEPEELILLAQDVFSENYSEMYLDSNAMTNIVFNPHKTLTDSRKSEIIKKVEEGIKNI